MGRVITTFRRVLGDLQQLGCFPAITAEERNFDPELASLANNQTGLLIITRNENGIRTGGLHGGELRVKVCIATTILLFGDYRPAAFREALPEKFGEPDAVRRGH